MVFYHSNKKPNDDKGLAVKRKRIDINGQITKDSNREDIFDPNL